MTRMALGAGVIAISAATAVLMTPAPAQAAKFPCICPQVYAPVVCDGGAVYPNQCFANCAEASGCQPLGAPTW